MPMMPMMPGAYGGGQGGMPAMGNPMMGFLTQAQTDAEGKGGEKDPPLAASVMAQVEEHAQWHKSSP